LIACWVARSGGAKDAEIDDFLLRFEGEDDDEDEPSGQTWQEQLAIMEAMAARSKAQRDAGVTG
jgi:hypothetical protein